MAYFQLLGLAMTEYLRPWKLVTLALGIALLIFGAWYESLPDWDAGLSILMAVLTYLTAPYVCRSIVTLDWRKWPPAALLAWVTIDGSYVMYCEAMHYVYVREANIWASIPLYFMPGIVWMWDGSVREFFRSIEWSPPCTMLKK